MATSAKDIIIRVIPSKLANGFIRRNHYSGKVVPNSSLHLGVFLDGNLHGVMQLGPSTNKKGTMKLVSGTDWNEFIELNRMAFDDILPRNSESRAISIAIKLIKKNAPHIKWIISFADGCQCGDGTIYRASGFVLTGIASNTTLRINPKDGCSMHSIQAHHLKVPASEWNLWKPLIGKQFRYIYFVHPKELTNLTVPIIPYSKIKEIGAGMYKGKKINAAVV